MRKRAYRATVVKDVRIAEVIPRLAEGPVCVGLDVSKAEVFAVVRDSRGHYERESRRSGKVADIQLLEPRFSVIECGHRGQGIVADLVRKLAVSC
jgi:hypothetical protein